MFQLVYASTAAREMTSSDLETLLRAARKKNDRLDVTGMLLYRDEHFVQVLEGREHTVRRLYDTIRSDDRHTHVITLRERLVEEREFPSWTMGFRNLNGTAGQKEELPEGYVPFMNGGFTSRHFRQAPGQVHEALLQFRDVAPRPPQ